MQTQFTPEKQDLLQDLDGLTASIPATKGQRLGNLLIDLLLAYLFSYLVAVAVLIPVFVANSSSDNSSMELLAVILFYGAFLFYYTGFEAANKGRTIGKMITGTYAKREDNAPLTWKDAFLRSLCRMVPFEVFSGLGDAPWHDKWTKTTVVKKS